MGYANTYSYGQIELSTGQRGDVDTFTNLGFQTNYINLVYIPEYPIAPDYAYVDIIIQKLTDTSGAANYLLNGSEIQIRDTGLTYRTAGSLSQGVLYTEANATINTYYVLPGRINIAQYITPGADQMIALYGKSAGTSLLYYNHSGRLRLYFNVR